MLGSVRDRCDGVPGCYVCAAVPGQPRAPRHLLQVTLADLGPRSVRCLGSLGRYKQRLIRHASIRRVKPSVLHAR